MTTGTLVALFSTLTPLREVVPVPLENLLNASPPIEQSCVSGRGHPQPYALILLDEELHKRMEGTKRSQLAVVVFPTG